MTLPENYPFPAAGDAEVRRWIATDETPYARIRAAAPWLGTDLEVTAYIAGIKAGLAGLPIESIKSQDPQ